MAHLHAPSVTNKLLEKTRGRIKLYLGTFLTRKEIMGDQSID